MSGPDSLELALEMKRKERKIFEHLVLACTMIDLMNGLGLVRSIENLLEIPIFTLEISQSSLF